MNVAQSRINLKTNFKDAAKLVNERNQKSQFLFLYLFWLINVVASISSTSQGYVLLLFPKQVEDSMLGFIFKNISGDWVHIFVVAICNFLVDLALFFIYMFYKNRFEISGRRTILLLLIGHLIGIAIYVIGLVNENIQEIAKGVISSLLPFSLYFVVVRYLPRKYIEILSPYSAVFVARETQLLVKKSKKSNGKGGVESSKRRLGLYINALLLVLMKDSSEKKLIVLIQKWKTIDKRNGKEIAKAINELNGYLYSTFSIQTRSSELTFDKLNWFERLLMRIVVSADNLFAFTIYSATMFPETLDLIEKSLSPLASHEFEATLSYNSKDYGKLIKYHLKRAADVDVVSARQKIYAHITILIVYLVSSTLIYLLSPIVNASSFPNYRFILLLVQYGSTVIFAFASISSIQKRYRKAGIDVFVPNKVLGYLINSAIFLIFFCNLDCRRQDIVQVYYPNFRPEFIAVFCWNNSCSDTFTIYLY